MNIYFLLSWKYPSNNAASSRISNYKKALIQKQYRIEIESLYSNSRNKVIYYAYTLFYPFITLIHLLKSRSDANIFFIYGFGWVSKLFIIFYCKANSIKVVFEINEKPYSIFGSKRDFLFRVVYPFNEYILTRFIYPKVDGFIVISKNLELYIKQYSASDAIVVRIPILVDFDLYQSIQNRSYNYTPYLIHSASLNQDKDGILNVLEAVGILKEKYNKIIHFKCTSSDFVNNIKFEFEKIIKKYNIQEQIHFLGVLSEDDLMSYQKNCELVVINKQNTIQNQYNFATKMGEFSSLAKPIITTKFGEVSYYFEDYKNCLFISNNSSIEIASKIFFLLTDRNLSLKIGKEALILSKSQFDYKSNSTKIDLFFKSL